MGMQGLFKHGAVSFHILYSTARAHPPAPSVVVSTAAGAQRPSSQLLSALTDCESGWRGGTRGLPSFPQPLVDLTWVPNIVLVFTGDIFAHLHLYILCLQETDHRCTLHTITCSENSNMFQKHFSTSANSLYTIIFIGCAVFHTLFNQYSMGGHLCCFLVFPKLKTVKHIYTDVLEPRSTDRP